MKTITQSDAAQCGFASLAMVAEAHGLKCGLSELMRRFPLPLNGAVLNHLVSAARQIGFSARPLKMQMAELGKVALPCILQCNSNHFVVLKSVRGSSITVIDPAVGERCMSLDEVANEFTGVGLELVPVMDFTHSKVGAQVSMKQLTANVPGMWQTLAQIVALALAMQVFVVLAPFLMQWVVDQVLLSADRDLLTVLGLGFGLAVLLQVGLGVLRGAAIVHLSSRLGLHWMSNVCAHLLRLPLAFFEGRSLGDVTSRLSSARAIQRTLNTRFIEVVIDGLMALVTLTLMLVYSGKLVLLTLLAVGIYGAIRALTWRALRGSAAQQWMAAVEQQSHLLESLRGMHSLKVAGAERHRGSSHDNLMVDAVNLELRLAHLGLGFRGARQLVFGVERVTVICMGALLAMESVFTVGMLIAYLAYREQFSRCMCALIDKGLELRLLRLHGERLADIVSTPPDDEEGSGEVLSPADMRIEVENVSFRYSESGPWVVKDCSFIIAAGQSVALVGASGCGKTTLIKLLLGLLRPTTGTIRIGGYDLQRWGARNVRALAGAVMQEDQLFTGSIGDNIGFFDADGDPARIEVAARLAAIHDDIMAMPMGYRTPVGDMGVRLSTGQKQRILLARALYRQPRLLFLDEATSQLDVMNERAIKDAVRSLRLTRVITAHRPEPIGSVGRVLRMEQGRIFEADGPQPEEQSAAVAASEPWEMPLSA